GDLVRGGLADRRADHRPTARAAYRQADSDRGAADAFGQDGHADDGRDYHYYHGEPGYDCVLVDLPGRAGRAAAGATVLFAAAAAGGGAELRAVGRGGRYVEPERAQPGGAAGAVQDGLADCDQLSGRPDPA